MTATSLSARAGEIRPAQRLRIDTAALTAALAAGASVKSAARAAGVSPRTLHRRAAEEPALRRVIDQGRARLVEAVSSAVARRALAGSVTAARFVLGRASNAGVGRGDLGPTLDELLAAFEQSDRVSVR